MSLTSITDECTKGTIYILTNVIQNELITTTNVIEANALRELLIRIQTDTKLLDAIITFNESFLELSSSWSSNSPSTSNSQVLARMLLRLIP